MFDISYDSAKRDLRLLEEQGMLKELTAGLFQERQLC